MVVNARCCYKKNTGPDKFASQTCVDITHEDGAAGLLYYGQFQCNCSEMRRISEPRLQHFRGVCRCASGDQQCSACSISTTDWILNNFFTIDVLSLIIAMAPKPYFNEQGCVLPFDQVMQLETIDDRTFRSTTRAYSPTGGENGTYGGHVYSQAAWAAAQTVDEGFVIHNITGWFTLGGRPSEHFVYTVHNIRDGYNYCTRSVTVTQAAEKGTMFTCTCSFKKEEGTPFDYQNRIDLKDRFRNVLLGKEDDPMAHPAAPSQDSEWFRETYLPQHPEHFNPIGGLHVRKVDMEKYNHPRAPIDRRQLTFYTLRGTLPLPTASYPRDSKTPTSTTREANLHACAHLYASDRNSLFIIPNHLGLPRDFKRMASLSHTVIFHTGIKDLIMPSEPHINHPNAYPTLFEDGSLPLCNAGDHENTDKDGRKWFVQESWVTRAAEGRGLHTSRMWDYHKGTHIATTIQDGLIRFKPGTRL